MIALIADAPVDGVRQARFRGRKKILTKSLWYIKCFASSAAHCYALACRETMSIWRIVWLLRQVPEVGLCNFVVKFEGAGFNYLLAPYF